MEGDLFPEKSVEFKQTTTRRYVPENRTLQGFVILTSLAFYRIPFRLYILSNEASRSALNSISHE
jgi:hypothetical protein